MPIGRKSGARFRDIAAHAKVGVATVDRVLNERGNVSAETAARVIESARILKVKRLLPTPWQRHRRYRAIFSRQRSSVAKRLNLAFLHAAAPWQGTITLERNLVNEDDPRLYYDEIMRCVGVVDGVIIVPIDDPQVRDAVRKLSRQAPVVAIISDIRSSGRQWFVGVDNYQAGRTAGYLVARSTPQHGKIVVLWRGPAYTGQADRVRGFTDIVKQHPPAAEVLAFSVTAENDDTVALFMSGLFRTHSDIKAVYNAGINEAPVAAVVQRHRPAHHFCYIAHELTADNIDLLKARVLDFIVDQNPEQQAQRALDLLLSHDRLIEPTEIKASTAFTIHCAESLHL